MRQFNIHEAKTNLSKIIEQAREGEDSTRQVPLEDEGCEAGRGGSMCC